MGTVKDNGNILCKYQRIIIWMHKLTKSNKLYFKSVHFLGVQRYLNKKCCQRRRCGFNPWVGKIPWSGKWQPTLVFLPGESHGWRSLVGYRPQGHKELDTTEQLNFHFLSIASNQNLTQTGWSQMRDLLSHTVKWSRVEAPLRCLPQGLLSPFSASDPFLGSL